MSSQPASDQDSSRYCPTCGRTTAAEYCPDDGVATVSWAGFSKAPSAYQVGDVVGDRYRIDKVLGRGGYGSVYAAVHTGTRQNIAVKMLDFDPREAGEVVLRRFYKEAQVTASLQHPNTVRVFDVGQDTGGPFFIAMEMLEGPTLAEVMKRALKAKRAMPERQASELATALLRSLQEAHAQKLVHRDLKPANIIFAAIAGDTVVKVLDFGIARTQDSSLTGSGLAPGTPVFMSPEQCRGQPVDARSDIYAVGIMLYLCCCGRLPFFAKRQVDMMAMHISEPASDPRGRTSQPLSEAIATICLKALAKKPDDRYQTATDMLAAIEASLADLPANRPGEFPLVSVAPLSDDERDPPPASVMDQPTNVMPRPGVVTGRPASPTAARPGAKSGGKPITQPGRKAPAKAAPTPVAEAPAAARKSISPLIFVAAFLLAVGMGVVITLALSPGQPAASPEAAPAAPAAEATQADPDAMKAGLLADMARGEGPASRRLDFAREAARLAPDNATYAKLVKALEAKTAAEAPVAAEDPKPVAAPADKADPAPRDVRKKVRPRKARRPTAEPTTAPAVMD